MSRGVGLPGAIARVVNRQRSRCLFHWRASDGSLAALTGQTPTFARASIGSAVPDQQGRLWTPPHTLPAWAMLDTDGDGTKDSLGLLLDRGSTNLLLQSENLGTTWSATGTPTRTAAALTLGSLVLDKIDDTSGAALQGYTQTITFTGNAVKALSVYVGQSTSTQSIFRVLESGTTERLRGSLQWNANGTPNVTTVEGTFLGYEEVGTVLGVRIFRLLFATASVTAGASAHRVDFYPATTTAFAVGNTGALYVGGFQAENSPVPTGYVKTTTGTVARSADALSYAFTARPQAMTFYVSLVERGQAASGLIGGGLLGIGASTNPAVFLLDQGGVYSIMHRRASDVTASLVAVPTVGQAVELRGLLKSDGSVQIGQSINGGAEQLTGTSGSNALASAWNDTTLTIGDRGGQPGICLLRSVKIAAGNLTLDQMRQIV